MRIPRKLQLFTVDGFVHHMWQCHNKEFLLRDPVIKILYLRAMIRGLSEKNSKGNVLLNAYCAMDNHLHHVMQYKNGSHWLSNFMRYVNGIFGARYNRLKMRSGAVFNGRPKTRLIQDINYLIRSQIYAEANPIRAGMHTYENLHHYKFSSFPFYAYGIRNEFTYHLDIPEWYLALGSNPRTRQKKYRRMFRAYIGFVGPIITYTLPFLGSIEWAKEQVVFVRQILLSQQANSS